MRALVGRAGAHGIMSSTCLKLLRGSNPAQLHKSYEGSMRSQCFSVIEVSVPVLLRMALDACCAEVDGRTLWSTRVGLIVLLLMRSPVVSG